MMRRNPSSGKGDRYWYFVWMKPHWELMTFRDELGHAQQWKRYVVTLVKRHYRLKLTKTEERELAEAYRAMPRGRVVELGNGDYALAHGNDTPMAEAFDRLISIFGLTTQWITGHAFPQYAQHETQLQSHRDTFIRLTARR